ncbi:MAG: J domain-containing protein [Chloroflexi bacterium]|nr:J domain-containing protein [Chloroflexota bacterium]
MPFEDDPYRMLGLPPGASLNEIRSAYRRLAKKYHPDAAGDRALPRFLAIQTAYEHLVDGDGRLRRPFDGAAGDGATGGGGGDTSTGGRGSTQESWRAGASRARASREAWRARRSWGEGTQSTAGGGTGHEPGARTSPGGGAGHEPGARTHPGGSGHPGRPGGRRPGREHDRRHSRRATAGSTTYDEAADTPLDPEWDGGEWYGPSSGTYWTINPREYADPRKHGPEYQARARRSTGPEGDGADAVTTPGAGEADAATRPDAGDPTRDLERIVRRPGPRSLLAMLRRATSR